MILPIAKQTEFNKFFNERVAECLGAVNSVYGNILDIPTRKEILLNYETMRSDWLAHATTQHHAKWAKHIISLNPVHVEEHLDGFVAEIIPHELSHIICFNNDLDDEHGSNWRELCIEMGGSGEEFHKV